MKKMLFYTGCVDEILLTIGTACVDEILLTIGTGCVLGILLANESCGILLIKI